MFPGPPKLEYGYKKRNNHQKTGTRVQKTEWWYQKPERGHIRQNQPKVQNRPK